MFRCGQFWRGYGSRMTRSSIIDCKAMRSAGVDPSRATRSAGRGRFGVLQSRTSTRGLKISMDTPLGNGRHGYQLLCYAGTLQHRPSVIQKCKGQDHSHHCIHLPCGCKRCCAGRAFLRIATHGAIHAPSGLSWLSCLSNLAAWVRGKRKGWATHPRQCPIGCYSFICLHVEV